jgi:hypothetical protein
MLTRESLEAFQAVDKLSQKSEDVAWHRPGNRAELKAQFVHLSQEELASAIDLHLDRLSRDPEQFRCLGV